MSLKVFPGFNTNAIHAGQHKDPSTGALVTPIYANSTFAHEEPGKHQGYDYGRFHNPTRAAFENALTILEGGTRAFAFASGMAAASTILNLLPKDSHIIVSDDLYGGTYGLLENIKKAVTGLEVTYADLTNADNFTAIIKSNTKMVWVESPSNPQLKIINLSAIAKIAKRHDIISVTDNTFASPYLQNPLAYGFDISFHSTTKYINGHSDIIGGAAVVGDNKEIAERLNYLQIALGGIPSPFDVFLAHRGLKTLGLRMQKHCDNALEIAKYLETQKQVKLAIYPGLKSHPQHDLAKTQMKAYGAIITVLLQGDLEYTRAFLKKLELFTLAVSLGGVESLIQSPALMTHSSIPKAKREAIGLTDNMLRISIGIEDVSDLINDLENALKA